jgi:hypothetical protein
MTLGAALLAFAFCPWFVPAMGLLAIAGAADIVMGSTRMTVIQLLAPGGLRGRVMSLHSITTRGTGPLGGFQSGTTATFIGVQPAVGVGALICILATLVVALRAPAIRSFAGTAMSTASTGTPADANRPRDALGKRNARSPVGGRERVG